MLRACLRDPHLEKPACAPQPTTPPYPGWKVSQKEEGRDYFPLAVLYPQATGGRVEPRT